MPMSHYSSTSSPSSGFSSDASSSLFEPDVVLPSHFFSVKEDGITGGERRLMAALLSDGIEAFITQSVGLASGASRKVDAIEWVETSDHAYVFSFDNVCDSLGLNAEYLRLGLSRYVSAMNQQIKSGNRPRTVWKKIRRPRKK